MAAYERRQPASRAPWWVRAARPVLSGAAAAAAVLAVGAAVSRPPAAPDAEWVLVHPTARAEARVKVVDVVDPALDAFRAATPMLGAVGPLEGP
jgi:2-C-methyl-D-erythritol 4-phosphate cytidylyltransferase